MALDGEGGDLVEAPSAQIEVPSELPSPSDRLKDYAEAARGAFAHNTERAIRADTAIFTAWCLAAGVPGLPAAPGDVARFVDEMSLTRRPATVRRYVSSVSHLHRAAELPNPALHSLVQLALRRMNRSQGREQRQAEAMTRRLVDRLLDAAGATMRDARNRALLAVAYDTLARRSELVAMRVQDVAIGAEGHGTVTVRRGKTDQEGIGSERYLAPDTSRLIVLWLGKAKVLDGTLFRAVLRWGRVGGALDAGEVSRVFKSMAAAAGIPANQVARISAHSSRIGAAQDMAASDRIELPAIMQAGGWKSPQMVALYTRRQAARRSGAAKLAELQNRS